VRRHSNSAGSVLTRLNGLLERGGLAALEPSTAQDKVSERLATGKLRRLNRRVADRELTESVALDWSRHVQE